MLGSNHAVDLYAEEGGVDYKLLQRFKDLMVTVGRQTTTFPNGKGVFLLPLRHSHGMAFEYRGEGNPIFVSTKEGLGNKDWLAELMYMLDPAGGSRYQRIAQDTAMMGVNDLIAQGAMPVLIADEVAAGTSEWFDDPVRSRDFADGFLQVCISEQMALGAGESPAYKWLIHPTPPVIDAPVLSVNVIGIVNPRERLVTGEKLGAGSRIIGALSSGAHSNGYSLLLKRGVELPEGFLTMSVDGEKYLGDDLLTPTMSYTRLVDAVLSAGVDVHAILPGTGDGVAKLAFDKAELTYRVEYWPDRDEIPQIFPFIEQTLQIPKLTMLTTFNNGIGSYFFVGDDDVERTMNAGRLADYQMFDIGYVEEGPRGTVFGPEDDLWLPPPGE